LPSTWSQILLHIVYGTKNREPLITPKIRDRLYPFIGGIVRDEGGVLYTIGGMSDHVHMLVRWGTDRGVGDLVRHVKSRSSLWIRKEFACPFRWQKAYGVFSVSASNAEKVKSYIAHQEEHHRQRSFMEELVELLQRHGVEYDPGYLLD